MIWPIFHHRTICVAPLFAVEEFLNVGELAHQWRYCCLAHLLVLRMLQQFSKLGINVIDSTHEAFT
jgi:hypothetical protein